MENGKCAQEEYRKTFWNPGASEWGSKHSVQFSHSVVPDSLWPHESQYTRPPCPSPTPGVYPSSCPSSRWCHPAISSSVVPFTCCHQSLSASGSSPVSQRFAWGGQSIGVSASASVFPMRIQGWFPLRLTGLISLLSKGLLRVFSSATIWKHQFLSIQSSLWFSSHMTTEKKKTCSFDYMDLCWQSDISAFQYAV